MCQFIETIKEFIYQRLNMVYRPPPFREYRETEEMIDKRILVLEKALGDCAELLESVGEISWSVKMRDYLNQSRRNREWVGGIESWGGGKEVGIKEFIIDIDNSPNLKEKNKVSINQEFRRLISIIGSNAHVIRRWLDVESVKRRNS